MSGTEVATTLAKILPVEKVYDDLAAPAVRQVGHALENLVKCIRLATFPIVVGSTSFDQLERFLQKSVETVSEEDRVPPAPQILGPAIEGIRYEEEGSPIESMFAELLARSMDRKRVDQAHPAFPALIKQLSSDEAVIIKLLAAGPVGGGTYKRTVVHRFQGNRSYFDRVELDELPTKDLVFPTNAAFYLEHLWSLGLAGVFELKQDPIMASGSQWGSRQFLEYRLTDIGRRFAGAVLPAVNPA